MNRLTQKLPFVPEIVFNGCFILLYSLFKAKKLELTLFAPAQLNIFLNAMTYIAPFFVMLSMICFFRASSSADVFFRKYIFSLIIFIPMLITYGDIQFAYWLSTVHLFFTALSIYEQQDVSLKNFSAESKIGFIERLRLKPAQIVIVSFSGIIALGTIALTLPVAAEEGVSIKLIDAFFMATSATCVTGLATISVVDSFSGWGEAAILLLIQIGGLGFMTLSSSFTLLLGRSLGMKNQIIMQDLLDISSFEDLLAMITDIIKYTFVIEFIGGLCLTLAFSLEGYEFGEALYNGFFHSVSAFCNAGFALFNNSLQGFTVSPYINGIICTLIVLGGLGFIVLKELEQIFFRGKPLKTMSVHTKIVLVTSFVLVISMAGYIFIAEYLHALNGYTLGEQLLISLFQSITTRTAGFNTVSLSGLYPHSIYLFCLIMFIGASPGSTGGGVKTTTFAILFQSLRATLRGKSKVEIFERTVPNAMVVRATAIFIISLMIVSFFILILIAIEPEQTFLSLFFEAISAFATVGLSLGITPLLSVAGKVAITILMFIGRVGPLTLALAVSEKKEREGKVEYPEGRILIG